MMRIKYYYDVLCPYSWLGYQILAQKTAGWREIGDYSLDYIPHMWPKIYKAVSSHSIEDVCQAKYNYVQKDLRDICEHYDLPTGSFERMYNRELRSNSSLWFLNLIKKKHGPGLHQRFMEKFWERIYLENRTANCTNDFLDVSEQLEIPFSESQRLCMHTEQRSNVLDLTETRLYLQEEARAIGSPWIEVHINGWDLKFFDVMRLELIDEIFKDPSLIPDNDKFTRISAL
ncbi:unnamed protein product [Bursaphelenchus xylophilus]|uniref:(pine wood nematode) hypothetical protein n=1 Tax=Bursaphelenchus xylophilus TaxID=6326 RepID=A0A1I7SBI4_BURXY|nr:unnamed protein product [Bursaphelenchus xylophilus]CAG9121972.1 unnamed protein product [Bursaphelenchus xylophilus]